jgi:hypothetical protein
MTTKSGIRAISLGQFSTMSLVLDGFTAADGWTMSGDIPWTIPADRLTTTKGSIHFAPFFNEDGEANLWLTTFGYTPRTIGTFYTTYTYKDMDHCMWNGTDLERRDRFYSIITNAANKLVGDWNVYVNLRDSSFRECEGAVFSSLHYECSSWVYHCHDECHATICLPTRSIVVEMHRESQTRKILDNIKWSTTSTGIHFSGYHVKEGCGIPPDVLKRYKQFRNMQYTVSFHLYPDEKDKWVQEITDLSDGIQKVKEMFSDIPMCNSLDLVLDFRNDHGYLTRQIEHVHTKSVWMVDILVQAGKPQQEGQRSQFSDLPVELLKKIYFA